MVIEDMKDNKIEDSEEENNNLDDEEYQDKGKITLKNKR